MTTSGKLCQLVMNPSENPHFVDRLDLKVSFEGTDGKPGLLSSIRVNGAGGFLWIHKHMKVEMRFDYASAPTAKVSKPTR